MGGCWGCAFAHNRHCRVVCRHRKRQKLGSKRLKRREEWYRRILPLLLTLLEGSVVWVRGGEEVREEEEVVRRWR